MDRAGRETRLTITHLQGNLPAQVLVQLFDAYSRCVWNAGFQIAGHGDVMCATVQVILKADSALGRVTREACQEKKRKKNSSFILLPEECSTFSLDRPGDCACRWCRISDNRRKATHYGKRVPRISSPSCSSFRLKSRTVNYSSESWSTCKINR